MAKQHPERPRSMALRTRCAHAGHWRLIAACCLHDIGLERVMLRIVIGLLSVVISGSALAAGKQQWDFYGDETDLRLFYGVPESDVVTLNVICQPKRKRIDFVNFVL